MGETIDVLLLMGLFLLAAMILRGVNWWLNDSVRPDDPDGPASRHEPDVPARQPQDLATRERPRL